MDQDELTIVLWRMHCGLVSADHEVHKHRHFQSNRTDWLRFNRTSLLFSIGQAAHLCGITRAARRTCLPHMRARLKIAIASRLLQRQNNLRRYRINRRLHI